MKVICVILTVCFGCILLLGGCIVHTRNNAISLEENINTAISGIDSQLTTRYNKLLELAQTVKKYDAHESAVLLQTIQARGKNATEEDVKSSIVSLNAVAERYPELQSQKNYSKMMDEISLMENSISHHRHAYNESIREYNRFVKSFPACFFLSATGYEIKKQEYYSSPEEHKDSKPLELF